MSFKTSLLHAVAGLTDLIPRKPFRVLRDLMDIPAAVLSKPENLYLNQGLPPQSLNDQFPFIVRQPNHFEVKRTEEPNK